MTKSKRVMNFTFFTMNFTISMWISNVPTDCTTVDTLCPFDALNISFPDPVLLPSVCLPCTYENTQQLNFIKISHPEGGKGGRGLGGWGWEKAGVQSNPICWHQTSYNQTLEVTKHKQFAFTQLSFRKGNSEKPSTLKIFKLRACL